MRPINYVMGYTHVYDVFQRYGASSLKSKVYHLAQQVPSKGTVVGYLSFCGAPIRFEQETIWPPLGRRCIKCERLWERAA